MKEALKLALEALEKLTDAAEGFSVSGVYFNEELWARKCLDDAYDAMGFAQEALAQPEQEPVAWIYKSEPSFDGNKWHDTFEVTTSKQVALWKDKTAKPLYTTPPQSTWIGLTDDERKQLWDDWENGHVVEAAESKLKEKNS